MINYEDIEKEYLTVNALNEDGDDDRMKRIKEVIGTLPHGQKELFFIYCDVGTYAGVARLLHCSPTTIRKSVMKTRQKIWECL